MYKGTGPMQGVTVRDEDALEYALEQCGVRQITGDKDNLLFVALMGAIQEWFFSGNFCHYEDDNPEICQSAPEEDGPDPDEEYERYLDIMMEEHEQ